ncbi:MAG: ABC transporter ATP-binding protein [Planctomycetota bacterium]
MSVSNDIVSLVNLHKSFGSLVVLDGIDLAFERGKTTVVLGPSGTGKSVMLKHIMGLLRPDAGEVYFDGQRVDTRDERDLVELRKRMGFLFQMGALFDSMTVGQNVAFPLTEHTDLSASQRADKAETLLKHVGLPGIQNKMPGELSGGQRKRVALARAVALEPDLVLYDEPTTGLDPIRADVINELIVALRDHTGVTGIVVTHDMVSANKVGDRFVLLHQGKVYLDADPETFRNAQDERVRRFVNGQADAEDLAAIRSGFAEDPAG